MDEDAIFSETQAFHQNLVVRVVVPLVVVGVGGAILATAGSAASPSMLVFFILVMLVPVSILFISMRTRVTATELRFEMFPLLRRRLRIADIDEVEAVRYNPIREGGGWGVRLSVRYGLVVNVSGVRGVRVVCGRKRYLIGSRRPEELAAAIEAAREVAAEQRHDEYQDA